MDFDTPRPKLKLDKHCRRVVILVEFDSESEANPSNNLMMRRAGLSTQFV